MVENDTTAQRREVGGRGPQEERIQEGGQAGARQGQAARAAQTAARHRRRREDRLTRRFASWWERDPAALDTEVQELTEAGFRVRRETTVGARAALIVEKDSESFRVAYDQEPTRQGARLTVFQPAAGEPGLLLTASGHALAAVERLRRGFGERASGDGEYLFIPPGWGGDVRGAGGTVRLGRAVLGAHGYAARALTGSQPSFAIDAPELARAFPEEVKGLWARGHVLTVGKTAEQIVGSAEGTLARAHGLEPGAVRRVMRSGIGALVETTTIRTSRTSEWLFFRRGPKDEPLILESQEFHAGDLWPRQPFSGPLARKRVALIGCGSVGWATALQLARSGTHALSLFDDDELRPENLPRLESYLGATGGPKVEALQRQLEAVSPDISVQAWPFEVGRQVGTPALTAERPDLLINVSGEEISTAETNAAAILLGRPAIFAWVSNGVRAGRIIRVRPDQSACYECVRQVGPAPIPSDGPVPTDGRPWRGACFDVDAFASALTRLAVLTLAGQPVSDMNPDHVILHFGGVTPLPEVIHIARDPRCAVCR